ncbi:MAG: hypothetical protein CME61_06565 [Halobacteriovoraceae bacterium]|nr:hypothetical protein [Halobacteriovoraceae bacterium]
MKSRTKIFDAHTHHITDNGLIHFDIKLEKDLPQKGRFFSIGLHPWNIDGEEPSSIKGKLDKYILDKRVVALGECGLDRTRNFGELQKDIFKEHLIFAKEKKLNVVIHCVKAQNEVLSIVKKVNFKGKLFFHHFNGSFTEASHLVSLGHFLGVGKNIIKETKISKYLKDIPISNILIESDGEEKLLPAIMDKVCLLKNLKKEDLIYNQIHSLKNAFPLIRL